jgi:hypothetical protein
MGSLETTRFLVLRPSIGATETPLFAPTCPAPRSVRTPPHRVIVALKPRRRALQKDR